LEFLNGFRVAFFDLAELTLLCPSERGSGGFKQP